MAKYEVLRRRKVVSKVSEYAVPIAVLLAEGKFEELKSYLKANSNLPGPRGNLEMAYAFGDCYDRETDDALWGFVIELSNINSI